MRSNRERCGARCATSAWRRVRARRPCRLRCRQPMISGRRAVQWDAHGRRHGGAVAQRFLREPAHALLASTTSAPVHGHRVRPSRRGAPPSRAPVHPVDLKRAAPFRASREDTGQQTVDAPGDLHSRLAADEGRRSTVILRRSLQRHRPGAILSSRGTSYAEVHPSARPPWGETRAEKRAPRLQTSGSRPAPAPPTPPLGPRANWLYYRRPGGTP